MNNDQKKELSERLERASFFEVMTREKGWEFVKAYYTNKVQALANELLTTDKKIEEYEQQRQRIMGIRDLLGFIEEDVRFLKDHAKNKGTTGNKE